MNGHDAYLSDLPGIALVGVFGVVLEGLGACEFMVAGRGGADVALAGDLTGEACDGTGHCMVLVVLGASGGLKSVLPW